MVNITTTKNFGDGRLKICVYGEAGAGKTRLCGTTDKPTIILSAEGGLLSLQDYDIPVIVIKNIETLREAYKFLLTEKGKKYEWVCIDSLSEVAEVCLSAEKALVKDARNAYMTMQDKVTALIRSFRDLDRNIYMSAKMEFVEIEKDIYKYPSAPGKKMANAIPYMFDGLFYIVNKKIGNENVRYLQTIATGNISAKDRSGKLPAQVEPNLALIEKLISKPKITKTKETQEKKK